MPTPEAKTLFDIDNTLVSGFSIFNFADHLVEDRLFHLEQRRAMDKDLADYENKRLDYGQFARVVVGHYSLGLANYQVALVKSSAELFLPKYMESLLPYAKELVSILNQSTTTVAISGAPKEAFGPLARYLGINAAFVLEAEARSGRYTGREKINMALDTEKSKVVLRVMDEGVDRERSFAFGDSIHDSPLLESVGHPFVVTSVKTDAQLVKKAQIHNWAIVDSNDIIPRVSQSLSQGI